MISSEVQRTLVKSPPELWAELGDPVSLARHLEALGEIRITRAEPEQRVDWEADGTTGTVLMKPTGWGTKVTLSVTRDLATPQQQSADADAAAATGAGAPAQPEVTPDTTDEAEADDQAPRDAESHIEAESPPAAAEMAALEEPEQAPAEASPTAEASAVGESAQRPEPENDSVPARAPETEPHRSFFARLFARRRQRSPEPPAIAADVVAKPIDVGEPTAAIVRPPVGSEPPESPAPIAPAEPTDASEPTQAATSEEQPAADAAQATEQATNISAELMAAEDAADEETTAVLTAVLDRLGSAHHRPFSRS
jgi:hypothetical protein